LHICRKQYCLLSSPADAQNFPVIDEDEFELPPNRQGGIAHRIAEYTPMDDLFVFPNGFRRQREPTVRKKADVASVTETLVDCEWKALPKQEETGPPIDYGSWRLYSELGMMGITDFPHYHFNPEADELSTPPPATHAIVCKWHLKP
jgi:hypothetical protein